MIQKWIWYYGRFNHFLEGCLFSIRDFFRLQVLMSSLLLFISQVNFPLCTIAHTPRMPEHCVEYAKVLVWPQEHPFGGMTLSL